MNWKECGRDLILCTIPEFSWRDWENHQEPQVKIAGRQAEIWTQNLPNTNQMLTTQPWRLDVWCGLVS
jgi:hypothetical protein